MYPRSIFNKVDINLDKMMKEVQVTDMYAQGAPIQSCLEVIKDIVVGENKNESKVE